MEADALDVLDSIRVALYTESIDESVLRRVYEIEHERQFEDDRGPVRDALRAVIEAAIQEAP